MKSCSPSPWKLLFCIVAALAYLGVLVSYIKVPSKEKTLLINHPSVMQETRKQASVIQKSLKYHPGLIVPKFHTSYPRKNSSLQERKTSSGKFSAMLDKLLSDNGYNRTRSKAIRHGQILSNDKIVLIVAYMRTGSTFLGGIFKQYPKLFYLFEPIRHIYETVKSNGGVEYINGAKRKFSYVDTREEISLQEVHKYLTCKFYDIDVDSLVDEFHYNFRDGMFDLYNCAVEPIRMLRKWRSATANTKESRDLIRVLEMRNLDVLKNCIAEATRKCKEAPMKVIKFIRLRMPVIAELLPLYPKMKVIYLQRDPRGIFRSRVKTGLLKVADFRDSLNGYCNRTLSDVKFYKTLAERYPGRLKSVLYEDVAENPVEMAENIINFCGLSFSNEMKYYVLSTTSLGGADSCAFCVERGNSTKTAYEWRKYMNIEHVLYIDQHCSAVYDEFGFKKFQIPSDVRNFSVPSREKENRLALL